MRIADILKIKGTAVIALPPTAKVSEAVLKMQQHNVGAVIIENMQRQLMGILTERDIVHALSERGVLVSSMYVMQLMSSGGPEATVFDTVASVAEQMMRTRVRHLPIIDRGSDTVVGVVSMGDVMKSRLEEKATEVQVLQDIAKSHLAAA